MNEILIISNNFPPEKSGNASRIHDLAKNLVKLGVKVTVICPHPTIPIGNFERKKVRKEKKELDGIDVNKIWTWQPKHEDPTFLTRIAYYLLFPLHSLLYIINMRDEYEVIMTTSPPIFVHIPGLFAKIFLDKEWILDIRDLWIDASSELGFVDEDSIFKKLSERFEKICLKFTDHITITTRKMEEKLEDKYDLNETEKFLFLPNGVDIDIFSPKNLERKDQIIYAGLLGHAQDLENPILAMEKLNGRYDIKFKIVGDGDIRDELERLVESKGLENKVEFEGLVPREKIPEYLSSSKIGIAPIKSLKSLDYAVPSKIFEYMACELPFITSGIGEVQKITEESKAGVIAKNDAQSFTEKIAYLLENKDRLEEMGKEGRRFVEENFDREKIAEKLKDTIEGNR
ncbi:MAG: glycosyltransferase family 4 protein [Thermoplasmatota archaeon]